MTPRVLSGTRRLLLVAYVAKRVDPTIRSAAPSPVGVAKAMEEEARRRALGSFEGARRSPSFDREASSSTSRSSLPCEQWGPYPIVEMELDAAQAQAEMAIIEEKENKRIKDQGSPSTFREVNFREGKCWELGVICRWNLNSFLYFYFSIPFSIPLL